MADLTATFFLYRPVAGGIRILRCRSLDHVIVIPEEIDKMPVVELGAYAFSVNARQLEDGSWTGGREDIGKAGETEAVIPDIPEAAGEWVWEVSLPAGLKKVGAYAFYNCWNLKRLHLSSRTLDWGAGAFTGCTGVTYLDVTVEEGVKSCLKEVLTELRQTLFVDYHGRQEAKLVFPEFFEESVENTPAKMLETCMHGCGHQYRYCFLQSEFQFRGYDSLFPFVKAQESAELAVRLALGRLRYPYGLTEEYKAVYYDYVNQQKAAAASGAVRRGEMEELRWIMEQYSFDPEEMAEVIQTAGEKQDAGMMSYLMDLQYGKMGEVPDAATGEMPGEKKKRRRFQL